MPEPRLTSVSQEEFVADVRAIAASLREGGWRPDFLVAIGRGGLVPGTYLSHATSLPLLSVDHSTRDADFSTELLRKLARRTAEGAKLLFVDDINDSGRTIAALRDMLAEAGGVAERARFATLIDNVRSAVAVDYRGRTIDRAVTPDWFVFPWEAMSDADSVIADARAAAGQQDC